VLRRETSSSTTPIASNSPAKVRAPLSTSSDVAAIVSVFFIAEPFFSRVFFALKIRNQPY
jgi:hypothetical protein